jgi:23S rRNA (pseudouridine1915-N3)-methyltransferase
MKIKIIALGKRNDPFLKEEVQLYLDRLQHYIPTELAILEPKVNQHLSIPQIKQEETKFFLNNLPETSHQLLLLDERGKGKSSLEFAQYLENLQQTAVKQLIIGIGGSYGWDFNVFPQKPNLIKISDFVLPHQLVRLVLVEQLYRAGTILKNENYHH